MTIKYSWLVLILIGLTATACSFGGSGATEPPASQPQETSPPLSPTVTISPLEAEVMEALTEFNAEVDSLELSFQTLNGQIRDNPGEVAGAAMLQLGAEDEELRFAAIYALANTAESAEHLEALRGLLGSESVSERVLAAEALLVRGEKEAIPVLIAALNSEEELLYSLPVQLAWEYARFLLLQYTTQDFGLLQADSFSTAAAILPAWEAWWEQQGAALQWYSQEGVYR